MNGQLNDQPLVELIREINLQRLDGVLRLKHNAVRTVIYFEAGEIIYAVANLRELRLIEYIRKQRLLSDEQLASVENNKSDLAFASFLTEQKYLDQQVVFRLITKQVVDVLRVALLWTEGGWEFDNRTHLDNPFRAKLDGRGLLVQAARKMPPEFIATRLTNRAEIFTPVSDLPDHAALLPAEGFLFSRLEKSVSLGELVMQSGLPESEALRMVYGLALGGYVEREHWPAALMKEPAKAASAQKQPEDTTGEATSPDASVHSLATELEELLARLENAETHYNILDVEQGASLEDIKNSYYFLARRYHPDRFHMQAGTPLHATVESAFAKIAQAYMTLSDPGLRAGYDAKLAARERVRRAAPTIPQASERDRLRAEAAKRQQRDASAENDPARAESSFQEGFIALQQGQNQAAIISLAAAARLAPTEARFRAYYGRALASQPDTRRLAEAELQASVKLDPENLTYRLMLAELYCDLGFFRRAEGELKRVMSAEPNNAGGLKLMRRLEAATTKP
jgi:curved DNA-binding protein CbpA